MKITPIEDKKQIEEILSTRIKEDRIGGVACISKNKKTYLYKTRLEEDIKESKPKYTAIG